MSATTSSFRLGEWLVEPSLNRISRDDRVIRFEPKVMDLLACLAGRAGELITKQDLIDSVWRTEHVAYTTLTHAIAELRRGLGDEAKNPRYIETISKRGYRIIASVEHVDDAASAAGTPSRTPVIEIGDRTVYLRAGDNVIGRTREAEIFVDSRQVSRRHARIVVDGTRASIQDLGSKNGTQVGGRRLRDIHELRHGDEIQVGNDVLMFWILDENLATETADSLRRIE
jgi:DNA-binding winged helix-turn-helix (wHTH) protein